MIDIYLVPVQVQNRQTIIDRLFWLGRKFDKRAILFLSLSLPGAATKEDRIVRILRLSINQMPATLS